MAPEVLAPDASNPKPFSEVNRKAADMWSFAVVLWEMVTREIPFSDLSPMQCGLKIATESLRVLVPTGTYFIQMISQPRKRTNICLGISPHMAKMISICMKEDPLKRPKFDQIVAILEKMANQ